MGKKTNQGTPAKRASDSTAFEAGVEALVATEQTKRAEECGVPTNLYCFALGFAQHAVYYLAVVNPMTRDPYDLLVLLRDEYTPSSPQGDAVSMFLDNLILQVEALDDAVWDGYKHHYLSWHADYHRGDVPVERFPEVPIPGPFQDCPEPFMADLEAMVTRRDPQANNPLLMLWRDVHVECCRILRPRQFQSNRFYRLGLLLGTCLAEMEYEDQSRLVKYRLPPRNLSVFLDEARGNLPKLHPKLKAIYRDIIFGNVTHKSRTEADIMLVRDHRLTTSIVWAMFHRLLKPIGLGAGYDPAAKGTSGKTTDESMTTPAAGTETATGTTGRPRRGRPRGLRKGYIQPEMALLCGVSPSTLAGWEQDPETAKSAYVPDIDKEVVYSVGLREGKGVCSANEWAKAYKNQRAGNRENKDKQRPDRLGGHDPAKIEDS